MNFYLSIDFGTCNTVISYFNKENNKIEQIMDCNNILIPTTIYFTINDLIENINNFEFNKNYFIGKTADDMYELEKNDNYYFYQFKRFLGLTSKSNIEQQDFLNNYNIKYELDDEIIYFYIPHNKADLNDYIKISIVELVSIFFKGLYELIKTQLNIKNNDSLDIILTCPAYFHDLQRTQLKNGVESANFKVYKLYNEPTTASIYYINNNKIENQNLKFIVFDLGGGTIDTTVVEYHSDNSICEILDIDGNNSLGGIDIDNIIVSNLYTKYKIDKSNIKWRYKLKKYAEEIKIKLTYTNNIDLYFENVPIIKNNTIEILDSIKVSYSRHLFNNLINELVDDMIKPIITFSKKYDNINNIIFIGGPTQIPLLQSKVNTLLDVNSNSQYLMTDHNNLNNQLYKIIVSIGGSLVYTLLDDNKFSLLDIIPMDIGISSDNKMITLITKNSNIPSSFEKTFTTTHDCQRNIDINIYEGISDICNENTFIGSYKIIGIPPLPRGMILIKLLFQINYNGILNISINGYKNPSDDSAKSFDFKLCENIRLISTVVAKNILKKILQKNK